MKNKTLKLGMSIKIVFILLICSSYIACSQKSTTIGFNDENLDYQGRIIYQPDAAIFSWPGTSVTIQFEGTDISATLQDLDTANYYNVIVDNQVIATINTDTIKKCYSLASGLNKGKHELQLFKRTEWDKGKTKFYSFELNNGGKILPKMEAKKRKIEFYGNSITCGYGIEDYSGHDSGNGYFENNYLTYAALTARHFDAQYQSISKSGIGILVSWFPLIMPEMYDRTDPTDSTSKWDFSKYTPDIVVINLFQNDSWIVTRPEYGEFKHRFGTQAPDSTTIIEAYKNFVSTIRGKYPNASIICALGSMDATREGSPWPGYITQATAQLTDPNIYTTFFNFKNTDGHPKVEEQQEMANKLIEFIEANIEW